RLAPPASQNRLTRFLFSRSGPERLAQREALVEDVEEAVAVGVRAAGDVRAAAENVLDPPAAGASALESDDVGGAEGTVAVAVAADDGALAVARQHPSGGAADADVVAPIAVEIGDGDRPGPQAECELLSRHEGAPPLVDEHGDVVGALKG